jgi:hypothetical protein
MAEARTTQSHMHMFLPKGNRPYIRRPHLLMDLEELTKFLQLLITGID